MFLSSAEKRRAFEVIEEAKQKHKKSKTIVLQPYGSTATPHPSGPFDDSLRSMPKNMLNYFIKELSKDYNIIYMGAHEFHDPRTFKPSSDLNLREWVAIIEAADYFIGCDSCGQHMRKCFNKKASVMIAGTHRINITYKDFHIIERDIPFCPDSMRVSGFHSHMAARLNEERIRFTQEEIETAYKKIIENIEGVSKQKAPKSEVVVAPQVKSVKYS